MNHCVPDFEFDDDYSIPTSTVLTRPKKSVMAEDGVMELLWQNGQVVLQSQNQRSLKKSQPSKFNNTVVGADQTHREIPSSHQQQQQQHEHHQQDHLFMQEDEMASWLHLPTNDANFDSEFWADLLNPAPCVASTTTVTATVTATAIPPPRAARVTDSRPPLNGSTVASDSASRPPIPPPRRTENFGHFSRQRPRAEVSGPSNSKSVMIRESTVVDSSDTPAVGPESKVSEAVRSTEGASGVNNRSGKMSGAGAAGTSSNGAGGGSSGARDLVTCEMSVTSSPSGSSANGEPQSQKLPAEDRKRKGRENDDEYHSSEDAELESADAKKQTRGSSSTKRSRAAEVHNLSERRRRDRINEKMRSLQELIPRCNKSDKASMLDEAIEYLKSLQLQVQMMSMGCGMVPMMFPGVQQYMPNMGMGIGMGVGMGMDMGMGRPMMPFPNVLAGSAMPTPAAAAHLGPRFPMPAFHMPSVPGPDPSRVQAAHQSDPMLNSFGMQNPNQPRAANFVDPYQQYLALHHMQLQNQSMVQPNASKPSTSKGAENPENHPSG